MMKQQGRRVKALSINARMKRNAPHRQYGRIIFLIVVLLSLSNQALGQTLIKGLDFRRGHHGEGRLQVQFNQADVVMDIRREGADIVVELTHAVLAEFVPRQIMVTDFATPVKQITAETQQNTTKIRLFLQNEMEYKAYQTDTTLILEVLPAGIQTQTKQQPLSLDFHEIELREVLRLLADVSGMNMVVSDAVNGQLTLRLRNVMWQQALDIILQATGLAKRQIDNVILVAPAGEIAAREKLVLEAQRQHEQLEPLHMTVLEVKYAKAEDIAKLLAAPSIESDSVRATSVRGFLSDRGSVTIDSRTNTLLIRDNAAQLQQIRQLINRLDRPVRQVLIESHIVIASSDFDKELGVRFGATAHSRTLGAATSGSLNGLQLDAQDSNLVIPDSRIGQDLNVNFPLSNPAAGTVGLALAKLPLGILLELELSAMQAEGQGEVVSSPRVITSNRQRATIEQGTEVPYQEATSSGATNVSFKEAVLKLDVTPHITPDDRIVMDLEVSKDEAVFDPSFAVPSVNTRSVKTQVLVEDGETVVLGGIYEQTKGHNVRRVPFFSDLPYLGFLFRNTLTEESQRELLIFVTPKIVKEGIQY